MSLCYLLFAFVPYKIKSTEVIKKGAGQVRIELTFHPYYELPYLSFPFYNNYYIGCSQKLQLIYKVFYFLLKRFITKLIIL